jgi:hypothetical protein
MLQSENVVVQQKTPFKAGDAVFIRTATHFHTGKIVEINSSYVELTDASWIADTGELDQFFATGKASKSCRMPNKTVVEIHAIVDWTSWRHDLPTAPTTQG